MAGNSVIKMTLQVLVIIILSSILGIVFNFYIRKEPIPFIPNSENIELSVDVSMAKKFFYSNKALFIDARPYEFYKKLHIKGAINISPGQVNELEKMNISKNRLIITYCNDEMCGLSQELAIELYSLGYENVHYLKNGLKAWISQNLPIEKSK